MTARKKDVISKLGDIYKISPQQSKSLLAYHSKIRSELNEDFAVAQVYEKTEAKKNTSSEIATATSSIFGFIPLIGPLVETIANLLNLGVRSSHEKAQGESYHNLLHAVPGSDPHDFSIFSKELATKISEKNIEEIKKLNIEEAKNLAEEDVKPILDKMLSGESGEIGDPDTIPDLLDSIILEEVSIPEQSEGIEKEVTAEHQDLGHFTHEIIAHEHQHDEDLKHAKDDVIDLIKDIKEHNIGKSTNQIISTQDAEIELENINKNEESHFAQDVINHRTTKSDHLH